ncbi:hypothetical protein GCM10023187_51450 [Nibrella viscosa]|uniref:DUF4190 domain-containing protein n=1 Tax=Nibrella viscosa TaxID=1084524 RepID=A0ABP8KXF0_9BACT
MPIRLLLTAFISIVLTACQRQTAFFQPTARIQYEAAAQPAAAVVVVPSDSVYRQTQVDATSELPLVMTATAAEPLRQTVRPAKQQRAFRETIVRAVGTQKHIRPADESPARRPARNALIAGLLGVAGLAVAILIPNASILLLLAPVAGIWAVVAAIRAFNRSRKGDPQRGKATIGLILGILLLVVTVLFALVIAAWGGAFQ